MVGVYQDLATPSSPEKRPCPLCGTGAQRPHGHEETLEGHRLFWKCWACKLLFSTFKRFI